MHLQPLLFEVDDNMQDIINLIISQFFNLILFFRSFEILPGLDFLTVLIIIFLVNFLFSILKGVGKDGR